MCEGHNHNHEEVDIVDLLGVIIKRRKFIVWFIVCFTIFTSILVFLKEYKRPLLSSSNSLSASAALTTQNDTILASYIFLNKSDKQEGYQAFVSSLLFPAIVDAPTFEVQVVKGLNVNYLFLSSEDSQNFLNKYNEFVDELLKLKTYQNSMSEEVLTSCTQFKNKSIDSVNGANDFFSNSKDITACNLYYTYLALVQSRLRYVTGTNIDSYYFTFVTNAVKDAKVSKLKPMNDLEAVDIKTKAVRDFNFKKVVKYSALLFVFSVMLAVITAFVLEFWANNKKRLAGYWR